MDRKSANLLLGLCDDVAAIAVVNSIVTTEDSLHDLLDETLGSVSHAEISWVADLLDVDVDWDVASEDDGAGAVIQAGNSDELSEDVEADDAT